MKVIHFESGLGNQMLNYAELLAIKYANPQDKCYIETIVYELPEVNETICQWNGYELERIFGIKVPNIKSILTTDQWKRIITNVKKSNFWVSSWDYPEAITSALKSEGFELDNYCKSRYRRNRTKMEEQLFRLKTANPIIGRLKLAYHRLHEERYLYWNQDPDSLFINTEADVYMGQTGLFMFNGNNISYIEDELKRTFMFPPFNKEENIYLARELQNNQSVAIHARRGDALESSGCYYKTGYFSRATRFIKKRVPNAKFYIFSDPGSMEWCKSNLRIFGLSDRDPVTYVDWNSGRESFRDMQLMSLAKHNIISYSSFGWWSSFLNSNPHKITCSPVYSMNTTHHF